MCTVDPIIVLKHRVSVIIYGMTDNYETAVYLFELDGLFIVHQATSYLVFNWSRCSDFLPDSVHDGNADGIFLGALNRQHTDNLRVCPVSI